MWPGDLSRKTDVGASGVIRDSALGLASTEVAVEHELSVGHDRPRLILTQPGVLVALHLLSQKAVRAPAAEAEPDAAKARARASLPIVDLTIRARHHCYRGWKQSVLEACAIVSSQMEECTAVYGS
jgi:hypothetical protein